MPNERTIPSDAPKTVATFTIYSGGRAVSKAFHVLSVIINKEVNRLPSATIMLLDGEASQQTFHISSQPDFEPGKEIEIKAGYRSDEETIYKGVVIKHSIKVRKKNSVLVVECRDKAVKMTVTCNSRYFKDVKDSDIMEELIDHYGIDKQIAVTSLQHQQMVQYNCTDWDFMLSRCDALGLLCMTNDNKITIDKPQFGGNAALIIQYGATVLDLDAEIDARLQFKNIKGSSWDYTGQELLDTVEAEESGVPHAGNLSSSDLAAVTGNDGFTLVNSVKMQEPELQAWVNMKMLKHQLARIRGSVRTDGTAAVIPGQLIELKGVGDRFEGKLYVTGVRHEIQEGSWQTVFQFGIDPGWFAETYKIQQPLAGAVIPPINGLQIGIVTQLQDDPDGENRILVRVPVIHKEDEGAWCRVSTLDAGNERGTFFLPEIEDEVIVGFINNDPRHGIVLGMLNSSSKPAPLTASDDNHEKGYQSRSKMKWLFNDDKKSLNIETPAGNKIILTEEDKKILLEDQNGNKILMNEEGITIESIKDVILKASGDIKMEGTNINVKGSAQTKVEGSSGAELSSGATTIVKGSMVQIN
ncbi:type VI secretion system tip protein VgrG [Niabella aquatica]